MKKLLLLLTVFFIWHNATGQQIKLKQIKEFSGYALARSNTDSLLNVDSTLLKGAFLPKNFPGIQNVYANGYWLNIDGKLNLIGTTNDTTVKALKIGTGTPTDTRSYIAFTPVINNVDGTNPNNGINNELRVNATSNTNGRTIRALKSVALFNPGGFSHTNGGGTACGVEGVSRLIDTGYVKVMVGMYARVLNDVNKAAAKIGNAVCMYMPTSQKAVLGVIDNAAGLVIAEQARPSGDTTLTKRSANLLLGPLNIYGALIDTPALAIPLGHYDIYSVSDYPSIFKSNVRSPKSPVDSADFTNKKYVDSLFAGAGSYLPKTFPSNQSVTMGSYSLSVAGNANISFSANGSIAAGLSILNSGNIIINSEYTTAINANNHVALITDTVQVGGTSGAGYVNVLTDSISANRSQHLSNYSGLIPVVLKGSGSKSGFTIQDSQADSVVITVTGAAVGDVVSIGIPVTVGSSNLTVKAFVSAPNAVTVRFDNVSGGSSVTVASAVYNVLVFKAGQ